MHITIHMEKFNFTTLVTKPLIKFESICCGMCVCVGRKGETECTLSNHMHPVNLHRLGQLPDLPSTHEYTELHDSLFPNFFQPNNPREEYVPPSELLKIK